MSTESPSWGRLGRAVRAVPFDLLLVVSVALFVATNLRATPDVASVRTLLGAVFLFFAPGYVLLAALVPDASHVGESRFTPTTFAERLLLAFGASVTLLPLFALAVAVAGPLSTPRIVASVAAFVVLGTVVGWIRRLRLPVERRYSVPTDRWLTQARAFLTGGSAVTTAVNVTLACSVLLGLGAGAYAVTTPQPDAEFTEFALLTENGGSEYVSGDYPTNLTRGQAANLTVSVENQRREAARYTVVAELQQVRVTDDRIRVLSQSEQNRFSRTVGPGQTWYRPHRIRPRQAGTDQRLVYYLYRGAAPDDASAATADRHLQLWVNVSTGLGAANDTAQRR
ncbi:Uncharacterized membrane protein [Halorientalis persicus]|jgi:uncharacterized membrane protein|uniref:Uncharacterized membrane protein n=1 Tax=Halorientalis persicus TaxID=1367881 RepID=A0A1H8SLF5_9EURY|nr:DUF1616 domain-containing protein [Halorientalis persicus]SEO79194.1 Uncharacterized membrane protein [Halorientalis persicus]